MCCSEHMSNDNPSLQSNYSVHFGPVPRTCYEFNLHMSQLISSEFFGCATSVSRYDLNLLASMLTPVMSMCQINDILIASMLTPVMSMCQINDILIASMLTPLMPMCQINGIMVSCQSVLHQFSLQK